MNVKRYNIAKPRKYTSQGVEKTAWDNVGTMTEFHKDDGTVSRKIEIPAISLDAQVFAIEPKKEGFGAYESAATGAVSPKDIPF